jgi:hypothetical protein
MMAMDWKADYKYPKFSGIFDFSSGEEPFLLARAAMMAVFFMHTDNILGMEVYGGY